MLENAPTDQAIEVAYTAAQARYAAMGVDTARALETLAEIPISLQCWQGDDVGGFENLAALSGGGIQATGNYPGKARTPDELRQDAALALRLIPGTHRFNLHAMYAETDGKQVARDALMPEHFAGWVDWARELGIGLDFNPTCFAHPLADSGFTLSSRDKGIREFWVAHCIACRQIGAAMGKALGTPCVNNIWIPDGYKDMPFDRMTPRSLLRESLDAVFADAFDPAHLRDAVESKLFGIGSESYVVGSHEFYLAYALEKQVLLCLDTGHFHPTEMVSEKLSAVLLFVEEMLLHISRGVRWDSDHVVVLSDEVKAIAAELARHDLFGRVHIGLDFFDASINRVAAWVVGARAVLKALLLALLEPAAALRAAEEAGDYTARLALLEEMNTLPFGAVWEYHCLRQGVLPGAAWLDVVREYERDVLAQRG